MQDTDADGNTVTVKVKVTNTGDTMQISAENMVSCSYESEAAEKESAVKVFFPAAEIPCGTSSSP